MSLPPGRMLGPYEILSSIGAGGMGEVLKAKDTRLQRTVAVLLAEPTAVAAIHREFGLHRKDTGEDWKAYLRRLAEAEGMDNPTDEELRRFDKKRKNKKVSNEDWVNPHDPAQERLRRVEHAVIAEVDQSRIQTRLEQGWIKKAVDDPAEAFKLALEYQQKKKSTAIAFYGNVVDLIEYAVNNQVKIDLLSDQTSCHAVYEGGYCPQGIFGHFFQEVITPRISFFYRTTG